ncbi:uncharacterized protein LOC131163732 isoform X2 [Malania oleifera]|uniref:uncharacterized protein LOC131163732 isoform X2 n=1 Tax=Malania oleifera TaxID=397392 RepID=UPI0025AE9792|nr:uncharacterized protein LOC131163732 isoform X2 [Malania oleifera]
MGTRTNFYKTPSLAYKKDFSLSSVLQNLRAYNVAAGNAPPADEPLPSDDAKRSRKRRRAWTVPPHRNNEVENRDGPMSHQDYIQKRRMELDVGSSEVYQELSEDVLGSSNSGIHLVDYGSDESSSSECEERQDPPNSGQQNEVDQVKNRSEQRFAVPGEPVCVICGKYGEYICNETDGDICSVDCKVELLKNLKKIEGHISNQSPAVSSSGPICTSQMLECGEDTWDYNCHRWSKKRSSLCTYECWKCQTPGHLAEDCLVISDSKLPNSSHTCNQVAPVQNKSSSISRDLLALYKRCHQIRKSSSTAKCNTCHNSSTLATCLDCGTVFCDR